MQLGAYGVGRWCGVVWVGLGRCHGDRWTELAFVLAVLQLWVKIAQNRSVTLLQ